MDRKIDEQKIRNKKAVLAGTAFFFISSFFLSEIFQYFISLNFCDVNLSFILIFPQTNFISVNSNNYINFFALSSDLLFILLMIEIAYQLLKKVGEGFWRYSLILFIILSLGLIIISIFFGFYTVIIHNYNNDWITFFNVIQAVLEEKIIYSLGFVLATFLYLNLITRRIIKYIKT